MKNQSEEIIVIGAGMVGLACALRLQEQGYAVRMVDKLGLGQGTSTRNACVLSSSSVVPVSTPSLPKQIPGYLLSASSPLKIRPTYFPKVAPWLVRFLRAGQDAKVQQTAAALKHLQKDTLGEHRSLAGNSEAAQYLQGAEMLYLYLDRQGYLQDAYAWETRRAQEVEFHEVKAEELKEREPDLSPDYQFALRAPGHGFVLDSQKYLAALAENFFKAGGTFQQAKILDIHSDQERVQVKTDMGQLEANKLVIAAGVWSAHLAKKLGDAVPLESEGGYFINIVRPGVTLHHPIINNQYKLATTPVQGSIRFAGLVEFAGLDASSNFKLCQMLVENAKRMFPAIQTEEVTRGHGQRPSLSDSLPVIGTASRFQNIFYAFGHQHIGLSSGAITGRWIAELIATQRPSVDLSPFSVKRFA